MKNGGLLFNSIGFPLFFDFGRRRAVACQRQSRAMRRLRIVCLGVFLVSLSATASAEVGIEIAPFAGYRFGGGFEDANTGSDLSLDSSESFGLILDYELNPNQQLEVYLSRQKTKLSADGTFTGNPLFDLSVEYYHFGGLYVFDVENKRIRPFISGTLGITRMDPDGASLNEEIRFSLALGGGVKIFLTDNFGLRFDGRGIFTAMDSNAAVFCSGGCAVKVRSSGFVQGELGAGVILRF
jgi:hypothetical protein